MNFLPSFSTWQFSVAGLLAAAAPILIHLLIRRRQRRLEWAAMDLLLRAVRESRPSIRLRDRILLCLRCLALALFGAALAQPFFASPGSPGNASQPVELVLLMDNSLSMSYAVPSGTRLDRARQRARHRIEQTPPGSRYRVVPLCGSRAPYRPETTPIREEAIAALESIEPVDRSLTLSMVAEATRRAMSVETALARDVVAFSDLQARDWEDAGFSSQFADLPPFEIVNVAEETWENRWVAEIRLQDGLADTRSESTILVRIGYHLPEDRQLTIDVAVNGVSIASQIATLAASESEREFAFQYRFEQSERESGEVEWAQVRASISADNLRTDDTRTRVVPVISGMPIVFVDQFGELEDRSRRRFGETLPLRRLLAAAQESVDGRVDMRHLRVEQLTPSLLAGVRLAVVAGISDPAPAVKTLRQFVEQGGQLIIAAGGDFDPVVWNDSAWLDGQGILPLPIAAQFLGGPLDDADDTKPFQIDFESLGQHPYFHFAEVSEQALRDLYGEPLFFQAVRTASRPSLDGVVGLPDSAASVLARFDDPSGTPFFVEAPIGAGRVLFISTGLLAGWNTLSKTNAVLVLDRLARAMLSSTFRPLNFSPAVRLDIPLLGIDRRSAARLSRPQENRGSEPLEIGFIGGEQLGIVVDRAFDRGIYQIAFEDGSVSDRSPILFSVNGSRDESDLTPLPESFLEEVAARGEKGSGPFIARDDGLGSPASALGERLWWWLSLAVLGILVLEMAVAART